MKHTSSHPGENVCIVLQHAEESGFSSKNLQCLFFFLFHLSSSVYSCHMSQSRWEPLEGSRMSPLRAYHIPYGSLLRICTRISYIWFDTLSARARTRLSRHVMSLSDLNDGPPARATGAHLSISPSSCRRLFTACRNRYRPLIIILMGPFFFGILGIIKIASAGGSISEPLSLKLNEALWRNLFTPVV